MIVSFPLKEEGLELKEFAKSRAMRAIRASAVYVPTCQRAKSVPTSHFYLPINVPTWQRRANFSTWRANVPRCVNFLTSRANLLKGVPIFQPFFKRIMFFYIPNKFIPNIFYIFCIFQIYT